MKKKNIKNQMCFGLIIYFLFLVSCSQQSSSEKKTKVKAKLILPVLAGYGGGGFLIGKSSDGLSFSHFLSDNSVIMNLPNNANWTFAVMAWSGTNGPMTGSMFCDTKTVALEGADLNLQFNLAGGKCGSPLFGPSNSKSATGQPHQLRFNSCANFEDMLIKEINENGINNLPTMDGTPHCESSIGKEKSFRISLYPTSPSFNPASSRLSPVTSACVGNRLATQSDIDSSLRIPLIPASFYKIPIQIIAYEGDNCTGSTNIVNLDGGPSLIDNDYRSMMNPDSSAQRIVATIDSDLCSGDWATRTTSFAAGETVLTGSGPFYICNVDQLNFMATKINADSGGAIHVGKDFILGADINLGTDFTTPIGTTGNPFRGNFYGNHYMLSGLNKNLTTGNFGLFGLVRNGEIRDIYFQTNSITGTSSVLSKIGLLAAEIAPLANDEVRVDNITADQITIDLSSLELTIGGLIGAVNQNVAGSKVSINDITITSSSILHQPASKTYDMDNNVGGFLGSTYNVSNSELFISNIDIEANVKGVNHIGGIIGYASNAKIENANVTIVPASGNNKITGSSYLGGFIGYGLNYTFINKSMATVEIEIIDETGAPTTNGEFIGGAVGKLDSGEVKDCDLMSTIVLNDPTPNANPKIGGVIGKAGIVSTGPVGIINNRVESTITDLQGSNIGGISGEHIYGSIIGNYVTGEILSTTGSKFGGIAGTNYANSVIKNNYSSIAVSGLGTVGGLVGFNQGIVTENYVGQVDIISEDTILGALVGKQDNANTAESYVTHNYTKADLEKAGTTCTVSCGGTLGSYWAGAAGTFQYNINAGTITNHTANLDYASINGALPEFMNEIDNITSIGSFDSNIWFEDVDDSNFVKLKFAKSWEDISSNMAIIGNGIAPFSISDCNEWNAIGNDKFLLTRSYSIQNDIDFSTCSEFIPFGGTDAVANPFIGNLESQSFALTNIDFTPPNAMTHFGVIRILGDGGAGWATIGSHNQPLYVINSIFDISGANVGNGIGMGVGIVKSGSVSMQIIDSIITVSTSAGGPNYLGGLVGIIENGKIESSAVTYTRFDFDDTDQNTSQVVGSSGLNGVGGLVGAALNGVNNVGVFSIEIENSFVQALVQSNQTNVGGLIGIIFDDPVNSKEIQVNLSNTYFYYEGYNLASDASKHGKSIEGSGSTGLLFGTVLSVSGVPSVNLEGVYGYSAGTVVQTGDGSKNIIGYINPGMSEFAFNNYDAGAIKSVKAYIASGITANGDLDPNLEKLSTQNAFLTSMALLANHNNYYVFEPASDKYVLEWQYYGFRLDE